MFSKEVSPNHFNPKFSTHENFPELCIYNLCLRTMVPFKFLKYVSPEFSNAYTPLSYLLPEFLSPPFSSFPFPLLFKSLCFNHLPCPWFLSHLSGSGFSLPSNYTSTPAPPCEESFGDFDNINRGQIFIISLSLTGSL